MCAGLSETPQRRADQGSRQWMQADAGRGFGQQGAQLGIGKEMIPAALDLIQTLQVGAGH